jgi:hypothetical protein
MAESTLIVTHVCTGPIPHERHVRAGDAPLPPCAVCGAALEPIHTSINRALHEKSLTERPLGLANDAPRNPDGAPVDPGFGRS